MLTIEGEKFRGHFIGDIHQYESSDHDGFDYSGTGLIQSHYTAEKIWFHFETPFFKRYTTRGGYLDLKNAIINWGQERPESTQYIIVSYPKIYDLLLADLLQQSRRSKSLIPTVGTGVLTEKDLLRKGLLALPGGQILLPVEKNLFPQSST